MKLYRADSMRRIDAEAAAAGLPGRTLMLAAGQALASAVHDRYPAARRVAVLCGRGNNGGDGYALARLLHDAGAVVRLFELGPPTSEDAEQARKGAVAALGPPARLDDPAELAPALAEAELLIDALFGSGLSRPLAGLAAAIVGQMNASGVATLSVDVPSGIDADRAVPPGPHVRADHTVQLAGAKIACALHPARAAFGSWCVADIGIPASLLERHATAELLEGTLVAPHLPGRPPDAHKYRVGTVMVFAGSERYLGAAELACRAAYRGGAGLVTLAADERYLGGWPEVVFQPLHKGSFAAALAAVGAARAQTLVIGPGLDPERLGEVAELLERHGGPALLDAGALQPDERLQAAVRRHGGCVLTPHHGEAARLLGRPADGVRSDPVEAARDLAAAWGAVVVLKGAGTVIAAPEGRVLISDRGHPGMAVGGSGDVLAGLAGAWLHGGDPLWRCGAAAFVHGRAGELAADQFGEGLVAGDLVDLLPRAWRKIRSGA